MVPSEPKVLGGVLKSDAKTSSGGNHMLLGCLCLIANTFSMVRHCCLTHDCW